MKKQDNGFTLVELLAVIVVLAIIMVIAIPSIMGVTNSAKKESFFLYAESLQSKAVAKYTQDLELNKKNTNCAVYDIEKDLNISNTGKYEGWVKVVRTPVTTGKKKVFLELSDTEEIKYVKYCIAEGNTCKPDQSYYVKEGSKSVGIQEAIEYGYVLCGNYQTAKDGKLVTSQTKCIGYDSVAAENIADTYDYKVIMTIKDDSYAVEDLTFNKDMSNKLFYEAIDDFNASHKNKKQDKLAISAPSCSATGSSVGDKGTTTTKTTKVTTSTTTSKGTINVETTTTTRGTINVETTTTTTKGNIYVSTTTTTTRGTHTISTQTTTEKSTLPITTTTVDAKDESLHLSSLSISGYGIPFDRLTYNYEITVPNNVTSVNVNAVPISDLTSVTITGNENLGVGLNSVVVALYNTETGKTANYRILVKRLDSTGNVISTTRKTQDPNYRPEDGLPDPTIEESNAQLANIHVYGYSLNFTPEVYDYRLEVINDEDLVLECRPVSKNATVSVSGNTGIHDGSQIVVVVKSQNGYYSKSYTIDVNIKKQESNGTKYLKTVALGLGLILAFALIALAITKRRKKKIINSSNNNETNNNQGNVV